MGMRKGSINTIEKFKELVKPTAKGGRRRRAILGYIAKNPRATVYRITKEVYGAKTSAEVLNQHKNTRFHLDKLEKISGLLGQTEHGALFKENEKGEILLELTEGGKELCKMEGLEAPSGRADKFVMEFQHRYQLLELDKIREMRNLLSEEVIDTLHQIADDFNKRIAESKIAELGKIVSKRELVLPLQSDFNRILYPIWMYEVEAKKFGEQLTSDLVLAGINVAYSGILNRKEKRLATRNVPKRLDSVKKDMEKLFIALPVVKEKRLVDVFDGLVNFFDDFAKVNHVFTEDRNAKENDYQQLFTMPLILEAERKNFMQRMRRSWR
jgi:hypothetical protein